MVAGDILELGLASGVHGIREGPPAVTADLLLPPGRASEWDSSAQPAWSAGRWEGLGGGRAKEQGWGLSLEGAAAWLWLPVLLRGLGGGWLCELAWAPSVSGLVGLAWGLELVVPPEPAQESGLGRASTATGSSRLGWVSEPSCRDPGLRPGWCSEPRLFIGVPECGRRAAGLGWALGGRQAVWAPACGVGPAPGRALEQGFPEGWVCVLEPSPPSEPGSVAEAGLGSEWTLT